MNCNKRHCYYVPQNSLVQGKGYRVSIIKEDEHFHYPTNWFWGFDYEKALKLAMKWNMDVLGLNDVEVREIICSSMFGLNTIVL